MVRQMKKEGFSIPGGHCRSQRQESLKTLLQQRAKRYL